MADASEGRNSPLGRRFWTYEGVAIRHQTLAALNGILIGVHALSRLLANSEAFREQANANQDPPSEQRPLDAALTEGLFAALYFLSEHARDLVEQLLEEAALAGDASRT